MLATASVLPTALTPVVGRGQGEASPSGPAFRQGFQQGHSQRSPLDGVGPGAHLIQQDQGLAVSLPPDGLQNKVACLRCCATLAAAGALFQSLVEGHRGVALLWER